MAEHADPKYLLKFSARYGSDYVRRNGIMLRDKYPDSWTPDIRAMFAAKYKELLEAENIKARSK